MNQQTTTTTGTNGESSAHELFALTDEQILEIEPGATESATVGQPFLAVQAQTAETASAKPSLESPRAATPESASQLMRPNAQAGMPVPPEPPAWLAAQMKDPWSGEEARDLWNGVQQARAEAAAYRAAIATPEDARALKEIYPGGVSEARAAAERARQLDEIDQAYFTGDTAQRSQLAAMMLREDPAAFREMVFAGLRTLQEAGKTPAGESVAQAFKPEGVSSAVGATLGSPGDDGAGMPAGGAPSRPGQASPTPTMAVSSGSRDSRTPEPRTGNTAQEAQVAAYASFEKAANEELERSVGGAIERTLAQALPAAASTNGAALGGRLSSAIRQDIEKALRGDRQLGEQVAQILSGRRLDDEARAQVVRLIGERAQQLLPGAAKRVINEWTQATLAAHRTQSARADAASARREVAPASFDSRSAPSQAASSSRDRSQDPNRTASRSEVRRVDYRKLSDVQILEL